MRSPELRAWPELDAAGRRSLVERATRDAPHPYFGSIEAIEEHRAPLFADGAGVLGLFDGERCLGCAGWILRNLDTTGELFLVGLRGEPEATRRLVDHTLAESIRVGARRVRAGTPSPDDAPARALRDAGFVEVDRALVLSLRGAVGGAPLERVPLRAERAAPWADTFEQAFAGTPNAARVEEGDALDLLGRDVLAGFVVHDREEVGVYELRVEDGVGWIDGIALLPAWRGTGLGRRLLATAVALLREAGAGEVRLLLMASNTRAGALYRAAGFETIELRSVWFERAAP